MDGVYNLKFEPEKNRIWIGKNFNKMNARMIFFNEVNLFVFGCQVNYDYFQF